MKAKAGGFIILGVGVIAAGVAVWLHKKQTATGVQPAPGQLPTVTPTPATQTPQGAAVAAAAIKTAAVVKDLITAGAPVAAGVVAASTPVVTAVPAAGAISAGVGGSTVAGSVAATSEASAAAGAVTPAGSTVAGGSSGLGAFLTNPWTIAIGAALIVGGWIIRARRNETKGDREDFAESLGFYDETPNPFGTATNAAGQRVSRSGNVDKLFAALIAVDPTQGYELRNRALNVIGKHDKDANTQWMMDCLQLLGYQIAQTPPLPYYAPFDDEQPQDDGELVELMA